MFIHADVHVQHCLIVDKDMRHPRNMKTDVPTLRKRSRSRVWRFPKTLFAISRCMIAEGDGSGDLLPRSPVRQQ